MSNDPVLNDQEQEREKMRNRKKEIIIITVFLILQTIVYIFCGVKKEYIHMDEAYSLGLASYDKVEIQDNVDFYNTWHSKEYYDDYLSIQDDEIGKYSQVYENQKNDVHPPLYYLILRFAMGFTKGTYSKWPGIIVNIIIFDIVTIIMFYILQYFFEDEEKQKEKSIILAFLSSITLASLTNVIYIRMYALSTLNILITTLLHLRLLKEEKINVRLFAYIGISALIGSLTHYYYLFYLAMMYIIFAIKYIKQKRWKVLGFYTGTMIISAGFSLLIFPYSIQHLFFGYRGQGSIDNLKNVKQFILNIGAYIEKINKYGFNGMLPIVVGIILTLVCVKKIKHLESKKEINKEYIKILLLPTLFYFVLVAISSPYIELRYVMPVCNIMFAIVMYYLHKSCNNVFKDKRENIIIVILLIGFIITPIILKTEPEEMFSDKKEIVQKLGNELNTPTIYVFNSNNNRFLDDILLFAEIDNSYIAKDIECSEEKIKEILKEKNTSKGVVIFINEGQQNDDIIQTIKKATGLQKSEYLKRLNACDVYYVGN